MAKAGLRMVSAAVELLWPRTQLRLPLADVDALMDLDVACSLMPVDLATPAHRATNAAARRPPEIVYESHPPNFCSMTLYSFVPR